LEGFIGLIFNGLLFYRLVKLDHLIDLLCQGISLGFFSGTWVWTAFAPSAAWLRVISATFAIPSALKATPFTGLKGGVFVWCAGDMGEGVVHLNGYCGLFVLRLSGTQ
jgi:hypothetical protein